MDQSEKDQLAEKVVDAWSEFDAALSNKRVYPRTQFEALFNRLKEYVDAVKDDTVIHKSVAGAVSGIREYLQTERKRVPGEILRDADRMECLLFSGYDPHFEGFEPPGL